MRKLLSTILLLLLSTVAGLLLGEAMVRMVAPQRLQNTPAMFTSDDFLVFKLQPHYKGTYTTYEFETPISTNSIGLRDNEIGPKQENGVRIVGLGDSFSFANGVTLDEADTWFARDALSCQVARTKQIRQPDSPRAERVLRDSLPCSRDRPSC